MGSWREDLGTGEKDRCMRLLGFIAEPLCPRQVPSKARGSGGPSPTPLSS